ncbi:hypothetical protein [Bacillus pseudomycoides]
MNHTFISLFAGSNPPSKFSARKEVKWQMKPPLMEVSSYGLFVSVF